MNLASETYAMCPSLKYEPTTWLMRFGMRISPVLTAACKQFYDAVIKGDVQRALTMVKGGLSPSDILVSYQDRQSPLQVRAR
jgi:hypothetical protein